MLKTTETVIPVDGKSFDAVKSLCWQGDTLMDWVTGVPHRLDGGPTAYRCSYEYRFDSALASDSGRYTVLYERRGTKALLLEDDRLLRELNRSYYCASIYEYPLQFGMLPDGREILIHCPEDYKRLHIDEVATGLRLTERPSEPEIDFFHSRLAFNPSGTHLLNAGWVWHPIDDLLLYKTTDVLANPSLLDMRGDFDWWREDVIGILSAAFSGDDYLLLVCDPEAPERDEDDPPDYKRGTPGAVNLFPGALARYDLKTKRFLSAVLPEEEVGTIYAVGTEYALGLYSYPKLIHIESGKVVHRWPHLFTGKQSSSIIYHTPPPFAWDAKKHRFAVAAENQIAVITIEGID